MRMLDKLYCPKCGEEMKKGYIYSPRQIIWTEKGKSKIFDYDFDSETLVGVSVFKWKKVAAYRCKDCKIATFEYDETI